MSNRTPLELLRYQYHIPDSTVNLEEYLGSNWKTVLNFWEYCCTLTETQWKGITDVYVNACSDREFVTAFHLEVQRLYESCVNFEPNKLWYIPGDAIFYGDYGIFDWQSDAFIIIGNATLELIDMSENKPLIFVPFFDKA
jgi:hypothetical protein